MKIGSVSWVTPGTYLDNARLLEDHLDFVELLLYTWDNETKTLLEKELPLLQSLDLFYTIHLPTDTIQNCEQVYDFFKKNNCTIENFILHPLTGWRHFIEEKENVTLENLIHTYPVYKNMTIDIGHLMLSGQITSLLENKSLCQIKEFHLHGVRGRHDHTVLNKKTLTYMSCLLKEYRSKISDTLLINFEIFNYDRLLSSLELFNSSFSSSFLANA